MKRFLTPTAFLILALPAAVPAKTRDNSQKGSLAEFRERTAAAKTREQTAGASSREQPAASKTREQTDGASSREQPAASKTREQPVAAKSRDQAKAVTEEDQRMLARVTVYWARGGSGSDRFTRQHKAATGIRLKGGHCAVDPRRIPYGSQVIFPDGRFVAVDTGTAVINRKAARLSGHTRAEQNAPVIDRFFETKTQAERWEKTHSPFMMVRVIPPKYQMPAQRYVETKFPKAIAADKLAVDRYPKATLAKNDYPRTTLVVKK